MKKTAVIALTAIVLCLFGESAKADISIGLPAEFIYEITRGFTFGQDLSAIERLLIRQTGNFAPRNLSKRILINYLVDTGYFKKISSNKLLEPKTGATLEFDRCKKGSCKITADLNGDNPPNEYWVDLCRPKDKIEIVIKKSGNEGVEILLPDFWY